MASMTPYQAFGLSCPNGGIFYVCENSSIEFIGCCTVDACSASNDGTCPQSSLRVSSFSSDIYDDLPKQGCDDPRGMSIWWTCKFNTPPFMGCCSSNPCSNGQCLLSDLVPAKLSDDAGLKASFLSPQASATPTTVSSQSTSSTQTATTTHSSSITTDSSSPSITEIPQSSGRPDSPGGGGLSGGAIGGIATAAAIVLIIIIAGIMYRCGCLARRRGESSGRVPSIMSQNLSGYGQGEGADGNQFRGTSGNHTTASSLSKFSQHPSLAPDGSPWRYSGASDQGSPQPQFQSYPGSDHGSPPQQFQPYRSHGHSYSASSHPFLSPVLELGDSAPPQELATKYHNSVELQGSTTAQHPLQDTPYLTTVIPSTATYGPQGPHNNTSQPQAGGIYPSYPPY